jgi:hypothetical protein
MVVKKWKAMIGGIQFVVSEPLSPAQLKLKKNIFQRQPKNNKNQMNTIVAQNLKEFDNAAGWLSVFL